MVGNANESQTDHSSDMSLPCQTVSWPAGNLRSRIVLCTAFAHIGNRPDNLDVHSARYDGCSANRILPRPQFPHHRLVNDYHDAIVRKIIPADIAAFNQAHSHRLQITRRDDVNECRNVIEGITLLLPFAEIPQLRLRLIGKLSDMPADSTPGMIRLRLGDFLPDSCPFAAFPPSS